MHRFSAAPWPTSLKVVSALGTLVILGVGYAATRAIPPYGFAHLFGSVVACAPPAIAVVAALFTVRGYEVGPVHLRVQRLLWATELTLVGLRRVWHDSGAMRCSLRVFGNGGLFAITGLFQSRTLGRYRAFATDPQRAVVLVLAERTLVVTPADPHGFVETVRGLFPRLEVGPPG